MVVDFHVLADGEHDLVEEMKEFKSHLEIDMGDAILQYGHIEFVPQVYEVNLYLHKQLMPTKKQTFWEN